MKMSELNVIIIFLTVTCILHLSTGSALKCADYQIHFEKILGYRPPHYGSADQKVLLFKSFHQVPSVINLQCMDLCKNDHACESYVINFNTSECYGFTSNERRTDTLNFRRMDENELVEDISVILFRKTCLNIPLTCKNTLWPILRIPGSSLLNRGYLTVNKLVTRNECIERCLFETSFRCRSVSFEISERNNIVRMGLSNILNKSVVGRCILSRDDKNMEVDSFRVASIGNEYIENNCQVAKNGADEQFLDDFCSYEHFPESALMYAENQYIGLTDRQCQEKCFKETSYFCKGITYQRDERTDSSRCYIHSEDIVSIGPRALIQMPNSYYLKRVQCLNLSVRCTSEQMIIRYNPRTFFQGRMYTENHPDECGVTGTNYGPTFLTLPIGNEITEKRCGVSRAFDYESLNRTLIYVYVIIQNNPLVMLQSDRYIKVGCISTFNRVSSDGVPDIVSISTSMELTGKDYDGSGSLLIDDGGDVPKLRVFILDAIDNIPVREARIGQTLKFVISMESHHELYDLRAINLTATSEYEKLQLISPNGCPNNPAIFPALQQEKTEHSRRLVTKFKAFKFASTAQIKFNVVIQFCYKVCSSVSCGYGIISHGRRRRRNTVGIVNNPSAPSSTSARPTLGRIIFPDETTARPLEPVQFPPPVQEKLVGSSGIRLDAYGNPQGIQNYFGGVRVNENELEMTRSKRKEVSVPLELTLNVVEEGTTDRFVIGENEEIIIASLASNSAFCLDESLVIAIVIFWLIIQVLLILGCCIMVNRYKKMAVYDDDRSSFHNYNSGYYPDSLESNRHVTWADSHHQNHHYQPRDGYFQ